MNNQSIEIDYKKMVNKWEWLSWGLGGLLYRFCTPASQCPIIDPAWEDPRGVPIDAIIFGGRRPRGIPLVYQSFNWQHGVFVGATVSSEVTSAAEYQGHQVMHDPFSSRPFLSYNAGHYMDHWLQMEKPGRKMPKIFHVNWFRRNTQVVSRIYNFGCFFL